MIFIMSDTLLKKIREKMLMQFGPTQLLLIYTSRRRMNKESYRFHLLNLSYDLKHFLAKQILEIRTTKTLKT